VLLSCRDSTKHHTKQEIEERLVFADGEPPVSSVQKVFNETLFAHLIGHHV